LAGVGIKVCPERNFSLERGQAVRISADDSLVPVYVIPTNEELEIAAQTYFLTRAPEAQRSPWTLGDGVIPGREIENRSVIV
jgi:hypothetical protein